MAIFNKKDFILCDVPVPHGYPQSQTHAGISFYNGVYYLVTSPYPSIKRNIIFAYLREALRRLTFDHCFKRINGEEFENPMLYFGAEENNNPPHIFSPYSNNPLMQTPDKLYGLPSYCSDPDIFIKDGKICILNREVIRISYNDDGKTYKSLIRLFVIMGHIELKNNFILDSISKIIDTHELITSPCLIFFNNKYRLIYLISSSYNDGKDCEKIIIRKADSIKGPFIEKCEIKLISKSYQPWHISVFQYKSNMYAIVACIKNGQKQRCYQMLGKFNNNMDTLRIYQTPLIDIPSYRGSAFVRPDGMFVLYSTTVKYKMKGSNSVDGRDIIMMATPFEKLEQELAANE
ncbi:MAG: hypothetical protein LKI59_07495 [Bacteroidales bacterium]|jgi:hypothetical protein|nr:hypothetical protein [Bacteroidales bacterium]